VTVTASSRPQHYRNFNQPSAPDPGYYPRTRPLPALMEKLFHPEIQLRYLVSRWQQQVSPAIITPELSSGSGKSAELLRSGDAMVARVRQDETPQRTYTRHPRIRNRYREFDLALNLMVD
jgi:hypothetical protein